jgi:guanine deaminase
VQNQPSRINLDFLRQAIQLSIDNMEQNGGGPFGAVIVRDGKIIGRGYNTVSATNDPTAHGEVVAIRNACANLNTFDLSGCEIYTSCEPCPMCLAAIYWSRMDRIYYGASADDAHAAEFSDRDLYEQIRKPISERAIPMEQGLRDEAVAAFDAWVKNANRVRY